MQEYSLEELKQFDGKEGRKTYVACNGLVYDVTDSFLWQGGKHQASHMAGADLTSELEDAPHDIEFLKRFQVIGHLV
ncbi:MAG: cytochrome b5 domain-containing protein [Candidatus Humimicrobiaceae bacterium]